MASGSGTQCERTRAGSPSAADLGTRRSGNVHLGPSEVALIARLHKEGRHATRQDGRTPAERDQLTVTPERDQVRRAASSGPRAAVSTIALKRTASAAVLSAAALTRPRWRAARSGTGRGRSPRRRLRCIPFATGAASTPRPTSRPPTMTASWCETGGRRYRRCTSALHADLSERTRCGRARNRVRGIMRAVRGWPTCRRSSPTPSHSVIDGRRTRSPSTASSVADRLALSSCAVGRVHDTCGRRVQGRPSASQTISTASSLPWPPTCGRTEVEATSCRAEHCHSPRRCQP